MAKSIKFKDGGNTAWIDPTGILARSQNKKALSTMFSSCDTMFIDNTGGSGSDKYYHIATLGKNNTDDCSNIRIIGTCGSWSADGKISFDITYSSRSNNGTGVFYSGNSGNAGWNYFDIRVYQGTDGYYRIYFHQKNITYIGDCEMFIMARNIYSLYCNTSPVTPNGTLVKTFDSSTTYNCAGVSLYDNTSGTTGTVTLSRTSADFKYLEVFYIDTSQNEYSSTKIYSPNGKKINLNVSRVEYAQGFYSLSKTYSISGTSMTIAKTSTNLNEYGYFGYAGSPSVQTNDFIKVVKVMGY